MDLLPYSYITFVIVLHLYTAFVLSTIANQIMSQNVSMIYQLNSADLG